MVIIKFHRPHQHWSAYSIIIWKLNRSKLKFEVHYVLCAVKCARYNEKCELCNMNCALCTMKCAAVSAVLSVYDMDVLKSEIFLGNTVIVTLRALMYYHIVQFYFTRLFTSRGKQCCPNFPWSWAAFSVEDLEIYRYAIHFLVSVIT